MGAPECEPDDVRLAGLVALVEAEAADWCCREEGEE